MLNESIQDKQTVRVQHDAGAYTAHQDGAERRRLGAKRVEVIFTAAHRSLKQEGE